MTGDGRMLSIDVLRGLTLALMIVVNRSVSDSLVYGQLAHAPWFGMTLTDLVFPSFLFVVGAALSVNFDKYQRLDNAAFLRKVLTRAALIFLCGFLLSWFPFFQFGADGHLSLRLLAQTRILGVLQRIALTYCVASLLLRYGGRRAAVLFSLAALLGYWAVLCAFGDFTLTGNAAIRLDLRVLGAAHMYHGEGVPFDPEGILSTVPAVVNVLAGFLAGRALLERGRNFETLTGLLLAGGLCIVAALFWNGVFPIGKKLWTSSYVLCTVGIDLYVLALLVYVIDLRGHRLGTHFFEVLGRNTLFIYLLSEVGNGVLGLVTVHGTPLLDWLYEQVFRPLGGERFGAFVYALAYLGTCWLAGWWLDRRRIYIRL